MTLLWNTPQSKIHMLMFTESKIFTEITKIKKFLTLVPKLQPLPRILTSPLYLSSLSSWKVLIWSLSQLAGSSFFLLLFHNHNSYYFLLKNHSISFLHKIESPYLLLFVWFVFYFCINFCNYLIIFFEQTQFSSSFLSCIFNLSIFDLL